MGTFQSYYSLIFNDIKIQHCNIDEFQSYYSLIFNQSKKLIY